MTGQSYRCIAMLGEALRFQAEGQYAECIRIIENISNCASRCGEHAVCALAMRLAGPMVEDLPLFG